MNSHHHLGAPDEAIKVPLCNPQAPLKGSSRDSLRDPQECSIEPEGAKDPQGKPSQSEDGIPVQSFRETYEGDPILL